MKSPISFPLTHLPRSSVAFCVLFAVTLIYTEAAVTDWELEKGAFYSQASDDTAPSNEDGWFVLISVETESMSDATAVSISGSGVSESLSWDDGEWSLLKIYQTETEASTEFPNNATYTITLSGGTLGTLHQQVTLGVPNYPSVPSLTKEDASRTRSINTGAPFTFQWATPSATTNLVSAEMNEKISDLDVWDQETTPEITSGTVSAGMLKAGHCYQLSLANINQTTVDGAGGFGSMGYTLQTRVLLHDVFTVFSPHMSPIVGAWQRGDGEANNSVVLVFLANGMYFHVEDGPSDAEQPDGIERGSYSWNEVTGILTITPEVDTNGEFGGSHPVGDFVLSVSGDTLTVGDQSEQSVLQRVTSTSNPLVGGWRICNNAASTPGVLVFLENNRYFHAEVNDGDPASTDGMERGTYTWNPTTSAFATTQAVDTNGELGLSHPDPAFQAQLLGTRSMILKDKEDTYFSRISNAAVLPGWRLNKARNHRQTEDNSVQGAQTFWDIWGLVETRNPGDANAVTIRGGGIAVSKSLSIEGTSWTVENDYASEALLDAEFPSNTTYTLTLSGGELGTVTQEITMGAAAYPDIPFLTGANLTEAQSIDSTSDLTLQWTYPGSLTAANGSTRLQIFVDGFDETEFFEVTMGGAHTSATVPGKTFNLGQSYFGLVEVSNALNQSDVSGFGVAGFSSHLSIVDFAMASLNAEGLVENYAATAGLVGAATDPLAMPFDEGINNLLKYAFNMDASGADTSVLASGTGTSGLPAFELDSTSGVFQVEYVRRKGAGLVYTPKCSTSLDPSSFLPIAGTVTITDIDSDFERVVVSDTCDPATTPWWFGFVEVAAP